MGREWNLRIIDSFFLSFILLGFDRAMSINRGLTGSCYMYPVGVSRSSTLQATKTTPSPLRKQKRIGKPAGFVGCAWGEEGLWTTLILSRIGMVESDP